VIAFRSRSRHSLNVTSFASSVSATKSLTCNTHTHAIVNPYPLQFNSQLSSIAYDRDSGKRVRDCGAVQLCDGVGCVLCISGNRCGLCPVHLCRPVTSASLPLCHQHSASNIHLDYMTARLEHRHLSFLALNMRSCRM